MSRPFDPMLYLVTDSGTLAPEDFFSRVDAACRGGATLVQLREKERGGRDYLALARRVREITDRYHIPLVIDDRVDVALACGAAGVHVGQSDLPVREARALIGPEGIVGATAKTVEQARAAEASAWGPSIPPRPRSSRSSRPSIRCATSAAPSPFPQLPSAA